MVWSDGTDVVSPTVRLASRSACWAWSSDSPTREGTAVSSTPVDTVTDTARPSSTWMPASGFWSMMLPSGTCRSPSASAGRASALAVSSSLVAWPTVSPLRSGTATCEPPEPSKADRAISAAMTKTAMTASASRV